MNRIVFLDIAKAICIILVVVGHYMPDNSPMWYVMLNKVIYTFHMPLFMFVSGYVYIATKKRYKLWVFFNEESEETDDTLFHNIGNSNHNKTTNTRFYACRAPCNPFIFF